MSFLGTTKSFNNPLETNLFEKTKVIINLKSFDNIFFKNFLRRLYMRNVFFKIYKMPSRFSLNTLLRSPFVNKKSRLQVGFKVFKYCVELNYDRVFSRSAVLNFIQQIVVDSYKVDFEVFLVKKGFYF